MKHLAKLVSRGLCFLVALVLASGATPAQTTTDPGLAKGIEQVRGGWLDDGVTTLEGVVRRLEKQPERSRELALAYLYLGIAHAQADSEKSARGSFREALELYPEIKPEEGRWPPKVLRLFSAVQASVQPSPSPSPSPSATPSPPAGPAPGEVRRSSVDGLEYVWIPPGTFQMGCVPPGTFCDKDEHPRHSVTFERGFWMGKTEVTVLAFRAFVAQSSHRTTAEEQGWAWVHKSDGIDDRKGVNWRAPGFSQWERSPVVAVSWGDARAFCAWSGGRLPTEAEWEYAARAGRDTDYAWDDRADACKHSNIYDLTMSRKRKNSDYSWKCDDGYVETAPVGSFAPNAFGLHDTLGNAAEWCEDAYTEKGYGSPADPNRHVVRGGSWRESSLFTRFSDRNNWSSGFAAYDTGMRCARDAAP